MHTRHEKRSNPKWAKPSAKQRDEMEAMGGKRLYKKGAKKVA